MKSRYAPLPLAAMIAGLSGCAATPDAPPPDAAEAYLLIPAQNDMRGWAIVEQLGKDLPEADRARIGVPTVLSEASSTMVVPFTGACAADRALVTRVDAIARAHGVTATRCDATIPAD